MTKYVKNPVEIYDNSLCNTGKLLVNYDPSKMLPNDYLRKLKIDLKKACSDKP